MQKTKETRFGWGSLLAAFFGGAFFSQVAMNDDPRESATTFSESTAQPQTEVQGIAALPASQGEMTAAPLIEAESEQAVDEAQPFVAPRPEVEDNVYYPNCSAARVAGAAPVYADEPGYSRRLDRDGDGVGCE
jgi:hypothetical protein